MEEHSPKNVIKTVLIVLAVFAAAILYIFISSAAEGRNYRGKNADMYGTESLEYIEKPVMKVYVWQRNENDTKSNTQYLGGSSYFYDLISLPLRKGERLTTEKDVFDGPRNPYILITAEYAGEIFGEYDIKAKEALIYSGSKEAIPGLQYGGSTGGKTGSVPDFRQEDSSFSANDVVTLSLLDLSYHAMNLINNIPDTITVFWERSYGVDLNDYITTEKMHDVYPDAPDELKDLYRYVVTTHVTIHAKHPTKSDVTVATAVLAVRQISEWQGTTGETRMMLNEAKCYEENHTEIVVESYTQSDMFAFE